MALELALPLLTPVSADSLGWDSSSRRERSTLCKSPSSMRAAQSAASASAVALACWSLSLRSRRERYRRKRRSMRQRHLLSAPAAPDEAATIAAVAVPVAEGDSDRLNGSGEGGSEQENCYREQCVDD